MESGEWRLVIGDPSRIMWVLGIGDWVLVIGYWVLGIGYQVLGISYWVAGIGCVVLKYVYRNPGCLVA